MIIKTPPEEALTGLPIFPEFVKLRTDHQKNIEAWTRLHKPYSDYNFISLWTWNSQDEMEVSSLNDNLVIKFQDYQDTNDFFYTFLGSTQTDATAKTLLEALGRKTKPVLKLIPDFVVENFKHPEDFIITEDRNDHDYILAVKNMVELDGSHNVKKRNALKQFHRDHEHHLAVRELDLKKPEDIKNIQKLLKTWLGQVGAKGSFNESEFRAINKILNEHHTISTNNLQIIGLHLENELKAFSITEILENDFGMWHYKKADRSVHGLGVTLDHYTAKGLHEKGVKHLNYEQDLGIEGLRQSKMNAHPVYFLKKYSVRIKQL